MNACIETALRTACADVGIVYRDVPPDGQWHPTDVDGDPRGKGDARIKLFPDGDGGIVANWKGETRPFFASASRKLSTAEIAARERKLHEAEAERERLQVDARDRTAELFNVDGDPATHPYALTKRVPLGPLLKRGSWPQRGWTDALLVPIYQPDGRVWSIEAINVDGKRNSLKDGRKRGGFHPFGKIIGASKVLIGEGIATVAACVGSDGSPGVAAMSAGNLAVVASWVREVAAPGAELIFLADNDVRDDGTPNTGVEAAMAAAALVGGRVVIPELGGLKCDFWDVWDQRGPEAVQQALAGAQATEVPTPKPDEKNAPASDSERRTEVTPEPASPIPGDTGRLNRAVVRRLSDIEAKPITWLWPGRIACGKSTMIAGHPGLGKSQLALAIAATVSMGGVWPVDRVRCEAGGVILLNAEDDAADTIRPRLEAAGADLSKCEVLDAIVEGYSADGLARTRSFNLKADLQVLDELLAQRRDTRLIVIDPITAYLAGIDSHINADVRAVLAPLGQLAARHVVAILCISHLNKGVAANGGHGDALLRVSGSLAFVAASRATFIVARDPGNPARRLFLPAKNNISKDDSGLAFVIESHRLPSGIETSRILWERDPVATTADDALALERRDDDGQERDKSERDDAVKWLRDLLTNGPCGAKEVQNEARAANISLRTLRRAKVKLPIDTYKEGFGPTGIWVWRLIDAHVSPSNMSSGHLNQDPHEMDLPAKAATGHLSKGEGEHLSGQPSAPSARIGDDADDAEVF